MAKQDTKTNPEQQVAPNNGIFVIFGITGDLAKRKLLPALYQLVETGLLSDKFTIVGTTRRDTTVEDVISDIKSALLAADDVVNDETLAKLRTMMRIVKMSITETADYQRLKTSLEEIEQEAGISLNRLFYMAVPPEMFEPIVIGLGSCQLQEGRALYGAESRLLIEKPFGYDTKSALELIKHLETVFDEESIYRVDHYLAKETAQNILTFRLNNPIFRTVWNRESIDHIMITASEEIGIEGRANFYESTGALRDLIQSHLLQLLALTTMEEPADRSADAIHASKLALLQSITPIQPEQVDSDTVRGQYDTYRNEVNNQESTTETYAALKLAIVNDRWRDVPVLLRTGKALHEKVTEITLVFKSRDLPAADRNMLTIRIQPNEGIVLSVLAKKPSLNEETEIVQMEYCYDKSFVGSKQPDAYERVLIDAIRGDKTLFTTDEEVLASWRIIDAVLRRWSDNSESLVTYKAGSWGPTKEADKLAESAGGEWLTGQLHICPVLPPRI